MPASPDDIDLLEARKLQRYNRGYNTNNIYYIVQISCEKTY